jgi:hypothetical protein
VCLTWVVVVLEGLDPFPPAGELGATAGAEETGTDPPGADDLGPAGADGEDPGEPGVWFATGQTVV